MRVLIIVLLSCLGFMFSACNQDKVKQLEEEKVELESKAELRDSIINNMLGEFNQIQENLQEIKEREGVIKLKATDYEGEPEDIASAINEDVKSISELMKKNEMMIENLNNRLKSSQVEMKEFKRLIDNLQRQLNSKNQEIAELNRQLKDQAVEIGELYFSVDSLKLVNRKKEKELEEKIEEINEGYYAYGTFKELKEKNVITKEGGVLGLGSSETLKDDFNKEYFSRIDIRKQTSFLIYADKAELITTHPSGSYKFMGEEKVDSLVITKPDDFWKASRYLVIVID